MAELEPLAQLLSATLDPAQNKQGISSKDGVEMEY